MIRKHGLSLAILALFAVACTGPADRRVQPVRSRRGCRSRRGGRRRRWRRERGKGAVIGGLVGAGGGTLYGLNENKKHDESYRNAYAACMRSRGYTG